MLNTEDSNVHLVISDQARRNRSGRSGPGPTKNRRPCIIITTTLASCLAATSAGEGLASLRRSALIAFLSTAAVLTCASHAHVKMACSSLCRAAALPTMRFIPTLLSFFPKNLLGKKTRSCQAAYFKYWPWLTYDIHRDVVFCHLCVTSLHFNYCSSTLNS